MYTEFTRCVIGQADRIEHSENWLGVSGWSDGPPSIFK